MSRLDRARTVADIVRIGFDIYDTWRERNRRGEDKAKDKRIRELETELEKYRQENP